MSFELKLDKDWFKKGDILQTEDNFPPLKVISTPKLHYSKWYWRILNFLTFRLFFNVKWSYTVEFQNKNNKNENRI